MRTATGNDSGTLNWGAWDVKDLAGKQAHIEIVDRATGGWGHVLADHFVLSDIAAKIRSDETAVNLLVDGQVVRSTAGKDSEALDWASWDVSDLKGKDAQIQIVDRNTGGWGHILADQFTFADAPAQSAEQRSSWMDYGKDFYAAVTWNDVPDGRRIAIGWMNNWNYAGAIPTDPWRSAMSVPRELALQTIDGQRTTRAAARPRAPLAARWTRPSRSTTGTIPQGTTDAARPRQGAGDQGRPAHRIGQAGRAEGPDRQRRGDGDRLRRADGRALRRPHAVGSRGLQPRLPRRPASPARRPSREGPPAHPRRLVLGRGVRRRRPSGHHRPGLPRAPTATGSSCSPTAAAPRWTH